LGGCPTLARLQIVMQDSCTSWMAEMHLDNEARAATEFV